MRCHREAAAEKVRHGRAAGEVRHGHTREEHDLVGEDNDLGRVELNPDGEDGDLSREVPRWEGGPCRRLRHGLAGKLAPGRRSAPPPTPWPRPAMSTRAGGISK